MINEETFQSLLLQVSFKTVSAFRYVGACRFNPFSFRSPSKLMKRMIIVTQHRFNPFSFRSPSKRRRRLKSPG